MNELFIFTFDYTIWLLWIVFLLIVFVLFKDLWMTRVTTNYIRSIKWITLELVIPRDNIKSIRSMEQVFVSLHSAKKSVKKRDRFLKGVIEDWMSLEIASSVKGMHFFIRTQEKYRNLIEAAFFAQYPEAEIRETEDYTVRMPQVLPNAEYDISGTDYILDKDDAYPLRTYVDFEKLAGSEREEDRKIDPIATIAEVMSSLKNNEAIWLQLLVRPVGKEWLDKAKKTVDVITGKTKKVSVSKKFFSGLGGFVNDLSVAVSKNPEWDGKKEEKSFGTKTPGEQDILRAVQDKMTKPAFEGLLRFIYIDVKSEFTESNVIAVTGALNQFGSPHINSLKSNKKMMALSRVTKIQPRRKKRLELVKKKQLYRAYLECAMPSRTPQAFGLKLKTSIFSTEEIATLFHPPIIAVKAPRLHPTEFRKGSPPVDLPIKE